ncbi:MAG: ParA family protein [Pseudomonadota bacterium]
MTAMCQILAITNQKGGVGKTTTAVNLATALAACGLRILLVDLDGQGNTSTGLGIAPQKRALDSYRLLLQEVPVEVCTIPTDIPGLSIIPASMDLSAVDFDLHDVPDRNTRLKDALATIAPSYDYILIDCPPALTILTINALCAAHSVLIPVQCEFYALEGLSHLIQTINRIRDGLNPGLFIDGIVLTMYDRRNRLSSQIDEDVRSHFTTRVYRTVIPRNVRISEAPSHGLPIILYDKRSKGAQAYVQLAQEFISRHSLQARIA